MATTTGVKILYVMYKGLLRPGGEQSLNLNRLRSLEALDAECEAILLEDPDDLARDQDVKRTVEMVQSIAPRARAHFFRRRAALPGRLARAIAEKLEDRQIDLLVFTHPQSVRLVRIMRARLRVPVVWDARAGINARILRTGGALRMSKNWLFRLSYPMSAQTADHAMCVSENLKTELMTRYGFDPHRVTVIPNAADTSRFKAMPEERAEVRRALDLDTNLVFVYSGGVHQGFVESLRFFDSAKRVEPRARFLGLVTDLDAARQLVGGRAAEEFLLFSVAHDDVPRHLAAGDVGLCVRMPTPGSAVASPVKFAEFLACGLPVVYPEGVGDFPELVRRRRLGVVLDMYRSEQWQTRVKELLDMLAAEHEALRQRCRTVAEQELSLTVQTKLLEKAIESTMRAWREGAA